MKSYTNDAAEIVFNDSINDHISSIDKIAANNLFESFSFERLKSIFTHNFVFISAVSFLSIGLTIYFLLMLFN